MSEKLIKLIEIENGVNDGGKYENIIAVESIGAFYSQLLNYSLNY